MARRATRNSNKTAPQTTPPADSEISEADQWRIIEQSGILKKLPGDSTQPKHKTEPEQEEDEPVACNEIFNTALLLIPMASVLLLMEILVHYQYGKKPTFEALRDRMISGVPILSVFIFYSNRYKQDRRMQAFFFLLSSVAGPRLIWLVNRGNWRLVMKQAPPVAVAWIYAVFQLNIAPAVLSLIIIAGWVQYANMKIIV